MQEGEGNIPGRCTSPEGRFPAGGARASEGRSKVFKNTGNRKWELV